METTFVVSRFRIIVVYQPKKDTTEEIRTKIKLKRPACNAMSWKRKSFPLSLLTWCRAVVINQMVAKIGYRLSPTKETFINDVTQKLTSFYTLPPCYTLSQTWKSFSWVFKRGLIYFSLNNFSRFQIFLAFIILSCYLPKITLQNYWHNLW